MKKLVFVVLCVLICVVAVNCQNKTTVSNNLNAAIVETQANNNKTLENSQPKVEMKVGFNFNPSNGYTAYGNCFAKIDSPANDFPEMFTSPATMFKSKSITGLEDQRVKGISITQNVDDEAVRNEFCMFAVHLETPIKNACGKTNWIPCQDKRGRLHGFKDESVVVEITWPGQEAKKERLQIVSNGQGGANFRVGIKK